VDPQWEAGSPDDPGGLKEPSPWAEAQAVPEYWLEPNQWAVKQVGWPARFQDQPPGEAHREPSEAESLRVAEWCQVAGQRKPDSPQWAVESVAGKLPRSPGSGADWRAPGREHCRWGAEWGGRQQSRRGGGGKQVRLAVTTPEAVESVEMTS